DRLAEVSAGASVVVAGSTVVTVVVAGGGCVTSASISPRAEGRSQWREGRTPTEEAPVNSAIAPISDRLRLIDAYLYTTLRHLRWDRDGRADRGPGQQAHDLPSPHEV